MLCAELDELKAENTRLRELLDQAYRDGKRQAAPFSKGAPKAKPKRRGRKSGKDHGRHAHRQPPDHVDEECDANLPGCCPRCGHDRIREEPDEMERVWETDIPPVRPHVRQTTIHVGYCEDCGKKVRGRHPFQTSTATGAAASHVGPHALALAVNLNKNAAVSYGNLEALFKQSFGLSITRGGICRAVQRVGRRAVPTVETLVRRVRRAPIVSPDETGWKVAGRLWWLWVFATPTFTVYAIKPGRGFEEAASILGPDFSGILERDGWGPYRSFVFALHQSCNAHLLRRCRRLLDSLPAMHLGFPQEVRRVLKNGLALRDRRDQGLLSPHGLLVAAGRIGAQMDRALAMEPTHDENRKLRNHLRIERNALFTFLKQPGVAATNYRAEQAIRPSVATRKMCGGGNNTPRGAETQGILLTLLRSGWQQGYTPADMIVPLLRAPEPWIVPLHRRIPRRGTRRPVDPG
jgi:transposase